MFTPDVPQSGYRQHTTVRPVDDIEQAIRAEEEAIARIREGIDKALGLIEQFGDAATELSLSAAEARAQNAALGRGLGGAFFGAKYRAATRQAAAASNARIGQEVVQKKRAIVEGKRAARDTLRGLQVELRGAEARLKALQAQRRGVGLRPTVPKPTAPAAIPASTPRRAVAAELATGDELDRFLAALEIVTDRLHQGPVAFALGSPRPDAPRPDRATCRSALHSAAFNLLVPLARELSLFDAAGARIYCRLLDTAGTPAGTAPPAQTLVEKLDAGALTPTIVSNYLRNLNKDRAAGDAIAALRRMLDAALVVANAYPADARDDARRAVIAFGQTLFELVRRIAARDNEVTVGEQALLEQLVEALPVLRGRVSTPPTTVHR